MTLDELNRNRMLDVLQRQHINTYLFQSAGLHDEITNAWAEDVIARFDETGALLVKIPPSKSISGIEERFYLNEGFL